MKIQNRLLILICIFVMVLSCIPQVSFAKASKKNQYWPDGPQIQSSAGIVMEAETGTVLYEKNSNDPHYPASITKILTTLLALENSKMDEVVTFSRDSVYKTEGSGIARDVGEEMTMEQCLYGVMLASANECAYAVAEHVAGDIGTFIQMMNDRAAALGCQNTHFNNCNGLPDEQHYVSAYDMALIAREAFKNEAFRIICGTKSYTIPVTNKHTDEETPLHNHHQMLYPLRTRQYLYEYCLGGKTGYTSVANYTLVTYAEKDGITLICVVLDSPASGNYDDTRTLFDFCFDNFKKVNVAQNETSYVQKDQGSEAILGSYEPFVALDGSSSIILPITAEFEDVDSQINYGNQNEDILGSIEYTYAGRLVGSADLTVTDVAADTFDFHEQEDTQKEAAGDSEINYDGNGQHGGTGSKKVFWIEPKMIAAGLLGIGTLGLIIFAVWKFVDNFYKIKRKLHLNGKEKSPYRTIKQNKMFRKKGRKWF